jgi:hypothetical protein
MGNPGKLATKGSQDEENKNKDTAQYVLDITIGKQTHFKSICQFEKSTKLKFNILFLSIAETDRKYSAKWTGSIASHLSPS